MACPLFLWLPLMGAAAPIARVARQRLRDSRAARKQAAEAPRELQRWAPVGNTTEAPEQPQPSTAG